MLKFLKTIANDFLSGLIIVLLCFVPFAVAGLGIALIVFAALVLLDVFGAWAAIVFGVVPVIYLVGYVNNHTKPDEQWRMW